jgi:hypothetical protein
VISSEYVPSSWLFDTSLGGTRHATLVSRHCCHMLLDQRSPGEHVKSGRHPQDWHVCQQLTRFRETSRAGRACPGRILLQRMRSPGVEMSLAKLPLPIKKFLRALEGRDYLALRETLARDAAVVEGGRHVRSEAIRAWSETLFSDASFALYAIYATETGSTTTLIVLRRGTEDGATLAVEFQQRWRFGISEARIVMLTILPEPLPALPAPVVAYINATNAFDLHALLATFADDALVNDQLQDYWGKVAIAEWAARDIIGARLTMYVVNVLEHHGHVVVTAHIDGDYDKRGLPDPLALAFHFSPRGNEIVQLIILRNQAGT